MSKVLYPKPSHQPRKKKAVTKENLNNRPYHVQYTDPTGELDTEWRHYNSELAVKVGAWFQCKVLGFLPNATLFTRDELKSQKSK